MKRQRTDFQTLSRLTRQVFASLDLQEVLAAITRAAAQLMDAVVVAVWTADETTRTLVLEGCSDEWILENYPLKRVNFDQGIAGWVATHRRALNIPDVTVDPRIFSPDWLRAHDLHSALVVPIIDHGELLGVLAMNRRTPFRLDLAAQDLLETFGAQAGLAIRNARVYANEQVTRAEAERAGQHLSELIEDLGAIVWEARLRSPVEIAASPRHFTFVSRQAEVLLGYSVTRWLAEPDFWLDIVHPADRERTVAACQIATATEAEYALEYRIVTAGGGIVWVRDIIHVLRDPGLRASGLRGLMVDVTARHRAEERTALQLAVTTLLADAASIEEATRSLLRVICENLDWALGEMWVVDRAANSLRWAGSWHTPLVDAAEFEAVTREMVLAPGAGLPGRVWAAGNPEWIPDVAQDPDFLRASLAAREGFDVAFAFPIRTNGAIIGVVVFFAHGVRPPDDELMKLVTEMGAQIGQFAERKRTEEAFQKLSGAVEQTADSVFITDRDGIVQYVNPSFERLTGYTRQDALGQRPHLLKSGQHPPAFYEDIWTRITRGEVVQTVFVNRKKSGEIYLEEKTISPIRDARGHITHFVSTGRDITERRQLEDQLGQAQKMEAVGRLAGGIAHDFNNLLTIILGHAEWLLNGLAPEDPRRRDTEEIHTSAARAAGLIRQLLAFSRRQVLAPRVLDLHAVIAGMEGMLRRLLGEDVRLVVESPRALGHVRGDAGQLEQVILNLALNARDAMPRGGRLTIEVTNCVVNEGEAAPAPGVSRGAYVKLAVRDTGVGMDPETLAHVFEPFFTTKSVGAGTGLGLATVYGIVQQHQGFITVESTPGVGTTFALLFPRIEAPVEAVPPGLVPQGHPQGSETILLVEDEEAVRDLARDTLRRAGYRVLAAADGRVALRLVEQHDGPIHLLVTDVVMPEMSGVEVAERLTTRYPAMRVLYVSGYPDDALRHHRALGPGSVLLEKPFTPGALARTVREVLDRPAGAGPAGRQ